MTKTELQNALAEATQTNKKTAGIFLNTLSSIAYKTAKKDGEFVVPGLGKLIKQNRKARTGTNPSTKQKIKIPAKTVLKFRVFKVAKDAILGEEINSAKRLQEMADTRVYGEHLSCSSARSLLESTPRHADAAFIRKSMPCASIGRKSSYHR